MIYNVGPVCHSVCMYVCQMTTFESLDIRSLLSLIWYISKEFGSRSYMKVVGSRSRLREQKNIENPHSRNVKLSLAVTASITRGAMNFAFSMGFLDMVDRMVRLPSLSCDRK